MKNWILIPVLAAMAPLAVQADVIALGGPTNVAVGSDFDLAVQVTDVFGGRSAGDALLAFGFNYSIGDTALFSFVSATPGQLFTDLSAAFGGTPPVAGIATNGGLTSTDFTEPLVLATLRFHANGAGSASIGVTYDPTDLNQGLVYANDPGYAAISASTTVTASPTPEPASGALALLAAGALAFAARRLQLTDLSL